MNTRCQRRHLWLTPTIMFLNRTSTFSCIPACSQPSWSPTSTAICTHIWRLCSYGELKNIQIPTAVCIPRSGPISCHWLAPLHSSAASPFQLCTCTSLACHQSPLLYACNDTQMPQWCTLTARTLSCQCTHSWSQPLLPVLAPTTMCVFITGHCHYMDLELTLTGKYMATT